jgi:hypothetical protein
MLTAKSPGHTGARHAPRRTRQVSGAGSTTIKRFRSTRISGYNRFTNPLGFALGGGSSRKRTPTQPGFRQASLTCRVVPANTSNKSKVFGSHSVSSMTKRAPLLDRLEIRHVSTRFPSSLMRAVRATGCRGSFRMLRGNCNSNQKNKRAKRNQAIKATTITLATPMPHLGVQRPCELFRRRVARPRRRFAHLVPLSVLFK